MLRGGFVLVAVMLLAAGVVAATAAEPQTEAANAAVGYIFSLQNPDGGFPAFGEESSPGSTIDAVFAFVAAGESPTPVFNKGPSPIDYLSAQAEAYASDPGAAAKLTLGIALLARDPSIGIDPANFAGLDLLSMMSESFDPATGSYGLDLFDHAFFMLALAAADEPVPATAAEYLRSVQQDDGGWEFVAGQGSDSNTSAMALQALIASGTGPGAPAVAEGLGYLRTAQNDDGGFGFLPGEDTDPNSTALVIQALVAAGQDIDAGGPWAPGGHTPLDGLLAFRSAGTGAFQYGGDDSPFATYQAVPALMLAPFPDLETRIVQGPTPIAPTVVEAPATPTSTAATPVLPSSGSGQREGDGGSWWVVAALLTAGAGAVGLAVARPRGR